jgi:hypothetical protein
MATPFEVWDYLGLGDKLAAVHTYANELHRVHGLQVPSPLEVSVTTRTAGPLIQQTIGEAGGIVTVERLP